MFETTTARGNIVERVSLDQISSACGLDPWRCRSLMAFDCEDILMIRRVTPTVVKPHNAVHVARAGFKILGTPVRGTVANRSWIRYCSSWNSEHAFGTRENVLECLLRQIDVEPRTKTPPSLKTTWISKSRATSFSAESGEQAHLDRSEKVIA